MAGNFAWGVDIGNRALKAIKVVRDGDILRIDDFDVIEHETVLSNAGDNRESFIQTALAAFATKHQIKKGALGVGVSGQSSFARFVKLPPVETKKIPEIVKFEAVQQIPFPLDEVEWSYQLFETPDSPEVEVGIFAMRRELVEQQIQYFSDSELNVELVQVNPLAVYNALYYDGRMHDTTMIVDVGAETTDLIIANNDSVWTRSIPIGGNNFTEALVKAFKLNFQKAEELKRNAASSKYARQIFQAMRPVFADLVAEVQRSMGFYSSVHQENRIRKIIGIGGTFRLPGLQKYLSQNLQIDVERLDSLAGGVPSDPAKAASFNDNLLSMVSAYGLALQAMGEGKITSSLLPARIRRERMWQSKTKWFAAAAALFVLGTGVGYGSWFVSSVAYDSQNATRMSNKSVIDTATGLDAKWTQIQGGGGPARQRISNLQSLTTNRDLWSGLLQDFIRTLPPVPQDVSELMQTPRGQRQQITIDSLEAEYKPDISPALSASSLQAYLGGKADLNSTRAARGTRQNYAMMGLQTALDNSGMGNYGAAADAMAMGQRMAEMQANRGGPGGGAPAAPSSGGGGGGAAGGQRGFIVHVRGTTPYTGNADLAHPDAAFPNTATFLNQVFVKALQQLKDDERLKGRNHKIMRAELITVEKISDQRLRDMKDDFAAALQGRDGILAGGQSMMGPVGGGAGGPAGAQAAAQAAAGQAAAAAQAGAAAAAARANVYAGPGGGRSSGGLFGPGTRASNPNTPLEEQTFKPQLKRSASASINREEMEKLALRDRLTGESVQNDQQFLVVFAVVLDPKE